jgi:O-antigen/teichoic acid export membrane protein
VRGSPSFGKAGCGQATRWSGALSKHLKNLVALGAIQAANAILPLLIFPYALIVVGADQFANIVLAESIAVFLAIVVLYNFEIEGVAKVVGLDAQRDRHLISRVFSSVLYVRLLLFFCLVPVALFVAWMINSELVWLVLCWLMIPLGYAIQTNWLCQGMERNGSIAVAALTTRLLAVAILVMSLNEGNAIIVPLVVASMFLMAAVISLIYAIWRLNVRFMKVPISELWQMIIAGKNVFFANLTVGFYRDANVLILGGLGAGGSTIAAYSMAEKFVKMIQATIRPFNQLFFPRIISLTMKFGTPDSRLLRSLLSYVWPQLGVLLLLLTTLTASALVARDVFGLSLETAGDIAPLFFVMSLAAFAGVANFMLGMAGLTGLGDTQYLLRVTALVGFANVLIVFGLAYLYGGMGAAIGFVLAEMMMLALIGRRYLQDRRDDASQ